MLSASMSIVTFLAFQLTKHGHSFKHWFQVVGLSGARKISVYISKVEKVGPRMTFFIEIYLAISFKYMIPLIVTFITF